MAKWLRRLRLSQSGQGLIEYSLIISLVAVALTAVLFSLSNSTGNAYHGASNSLDQVVGCSYGSSSGSCPSGTGGTSTSDATASGSDGSGTGNGRGTGNGGGNGQGNHGNGNGNGGGDGSNGKGGGKGNQP
jgi:Flp pilus assembly pilin Flp